MGRESGHLVQGMGLGDMICRRLGPVRARMKLVLVVVLETLIGDNWMLG